MTGVPGPLDLPGTGAVGAGLLLGAGSFCLWWACWTREPRTRAPRRRVLRRTLDVAGLASLPVAAFVGGCLGLALVAAVVVLAVSGVPALAACAAPAAGIAPVVVVRRRAAGRADERAGAWPDVVDHLGSAVRAGAALPEALCHLAERGPAPLRGQFAAFAAGYRATGSFERELTLLCERLADPVADRIAAVLRMTRQVGGSDVGGTLRTLSEYLREDARTRAELLARQSWTVTAARLGVAAPWVVLGLLATRPGALRAYESLTGALVLAGGALGSAVAYLLMLRIARLPRPRRILA